MSPKQIYALYGLGLVWFMTPAAFTLYPLRGIAQTEAPAAATVCSFINANQVNVRQSPSRQSKIVTRLNRGDGVTVKQRQGNWVQIVHRRKGFPPHETFTPLPGWVFNQFINGCSEDQFDVWRS
jgi:SH3-like domain-containing protein